MANSLKELHDFFLEKGEAGWCKGHWSLNATGHYVSPFDKSACKWSMDGAAIRIFEHDFSASCKSCKGLIKKQFLDRIFSITGIDYLNTDIWHDAPERTFQDVLELLGREDYAKSLRHKTTH